jgi:AcrR family transcriptional regulator
VTRSLRSDAARNNARILDAAAQAFEEEGPGVSQDEIARRAGVGVATIYRRFRTREELIKAVAEHVFAADIATAIIEGGPDPWDDLVATLSSTVEAFAAHPVLVSLARESAVIDLDTRKEYAAAKDRVVRRARDVGAIRPEINGRDLTAVVIMALALVHSRKCDAQDIRRYLALLADGMRPTGHRLPEPGSIQVPPTCIQKPR